MKVGDLVQYKGSDRRIGVVISVVFKDGYGADVVKVWTRHLLSGERIFATWPVTFMEVLSANR